jgi:hypothetical protein
MNPADYHKLNKYQNKNSEQLVNLNISNIYKVKIHLIWICLKNNQMQKKLIERRITNNLRCQHLMRCKQVMLIYYLLKTMTLMMKVTINMEEQPSKYMVAKSQTWL